MDGGNVYERRWLSLSHLLLKPGPEHIWGSFFLGQLTFVWCVAATFACQDGKQRRYIACKPVDCVTGPTYSCYFQRKAKYLFVI